MSPESGPVDFIQSFERSVTLFQEIDKLLPAESAVTRPVVFIADMPPAERRMRSIALRKSAYDHRQFFAHDRRGPAVVLPSAPRHPFAFFVDAVRFRIFMSEPCGAGAGRSCQKNFLPVDTAALHNIVEPCKIESPLFRFILRPGKNADGKGVAVRLVHQPEIVVDNAGSLQPLIGVVVTAVKKMRKILYDAHNQILSGCF